jgi:predicted AlkP superfamily pyrophosphatase or phosphodiesterase
MPNVFKSLKEAGKVTAAVAYYWYSELYNRTPYDPINDREVDDAALNIQHGRFYTEDEYPDIELMRAAALMVRRYSPDYLLLHPMGMDYLGETFGSDTSQYRNNATRQDSILAPMIMEWREKGYTIFVTGDHGINNDGNHGGPAPEQREVPLFVIQPGGKGRGDTGDVVSHLQIAPTVLSLLNIPIPSTMKHKPLL